MNLQTSRLHLRPLAVADAPAIFAIMKDPEAMRFWDWPALSDPAVAADIVASQVAAMDAGGALYWVAALSPNGPAIGTCDLSEIDSHHRRAEIGFLFHRRYWGKGFASEAIQAIVAHAFVTMRLERLWARFHTGNDASKKLLERLGFSHEGTLKAHVCRDGKRRDCLIYGRLRQSSL
jgi:RimJ/RimL family protein N-acetyltransferase